MAMAFLDFRLIAINTAHERSFYEMCLINTKAHGAAKISAGIAAFHLIATLPFRQQANYGFRTRAEFGGRCAL